MEAAAFDRAFAEALDESPDAPEAVVHAEAFNDPQKELRNLVTYAARIQRAIEKTTAQLKSLQDERKAAYAKAEEEAMLLTELANEHKKISQAAAYFNEGAGATLASPAADAGPDSHDPATSPCPTRSASHLSVVHPDHGGFVYSFDEIKKKIIRRNRIAEARIRFAAALDPAPLIKGAIL